MSRFVTATCLPLSLPNFNNLQITFVDTDMIKADIRVYHRLWLLLMIWHYINLRIVTSILWQARCRTQHIIYNILLNYNWFQVYSNTSADTAVKTLNTAERCHGSVHSSSFYQNDQTSLLVSCLLRYCIWEKNQFHKRLTKKGKLFFHYIFNPPLTR